MPDHAAPTPRLTDLHRLALRRWRVLLSHRPTQALVEATLRPVARRNSGLEAALGRWTDAAHAIEHANGGDRDAEAEFRDAVRDLSGRLPRVDRFGGLAKSVEDGARALIERAPTPSGLAQLTAMEISKDDYIAMRDRLLDANFGLVHHALRELDVRGGRYQDAVHDGVLGLVRAIEGFDTERGKYFPAYAMHWIRTEIGKALARRERGIRMPGSVLRNRRAYARSRGRETGAIADDFAA